MPGYYFSFLKEMNNFVQEPVAPISSYVSPFFFFFFVRGKDKKKKLV
jgi:hypothetical protein